ncbi:hypothetical protein [Trinickia fusca]|uniref:Secreted protein n=1 Tax=Trinickia fusca TaxID=2419777 RepID=A0A494XIC1_9BURK|nr:hypothetical protein [Trinickia fusca]RKP50497.1 hypothetical protein D7S89_05170 [Trinickia fusca]
MKKMLPCAAGVALLAMLPGCASSPAMTPQQTLQIACPPIEAAMAQLIALDASMTDVPAAQKAAALLTQAQKPVAAACTAGATITATNVEGLAQQALPALGTVLATVPMPPQTQAEIQASLVGIEVVIGAAGVIEKQIAATHASATANARVPAPASAP